MASEQHSGLRGEGLMGLGEALAAGQPNQLMMEPKVSGDRFFGRPRLARFPRLHDGERRLEPGEIGSVAPLEQRACGPDLDRLTGHIDVQPVFQHLRLDAGAVMHPVFDEPLLHEVPDCLPHRPPADAQHLDQPSLPQLLSWWNPALHDRFADHAAHRLGGGSTLKSGQSP